MKTIRTFTSAVEADAARAILEANGICAFLADESSSVVGRGSVGVRLQVEDADVQAAQEILRNVESGAAQDLERGREPLRRISVRLFVFFVFLAGIFIACLLPGPFGFSYWPAWFQLTVSALFVLDVLATLADLVRWRR